MRVRELNSSVVYQAISGNGLNLQLGCFVFSINSRIKPLAASISSLYGDYELSDGAFIDFHIDLNVVNDLNAILFRKKAVFLADGFAPFDPLPHQHAPALFEWGMNWCVSSQINTFLIIHAAVVEKNGYAAVMPAPPGSGKSTLTASLIQEGWRLLSDELALLDLQTGYVTPFPRPVSLKNASIDLIRHRYPDAIFGPLSSDTVKGSVCHIKPPSASVEMQHQACPIGWVVFPKYEPGIEAELSNIGKASTVMALADNSFNYNLLAKAGFNLLTQIVERADCYRYRYSLLDQAIAAFDNLANSKR
ncbi:hypothetical protein A1507_09500 [Methylomonas koyamae]|uniref:Aldolase n=1 Tax=Methylomonas koyamae TaxID=702114 RepID=A0A177NN06_9GAMM|nr:hypothetical protein A1507_09500 [Methylomonas koyamae]